MKFVSNPSDYGDDFSELEESSRPLLFNESDECGRSGSCIVYRMESDGMRVAVKRLIREKIGDPLCRYAYQKEYELGRSLKHERLPTYWDCHIGNEEVYIVMDFIDGQSLDEFISTREGQVYFSHKENVRRFFAELLSVVGYLHNRGIVHCDLKPENIMLRHSDRGVMLIDLEKGYCDTRHKSHGGTTGISDPLPGGEVPTIHKDIAAICYLADYLAENVKKFPTKTTRKLIRVGKEENASTANLEAALLAERPTLWLWIAGVVAVLLIGLFSLYVSESRVSESKEVEKSLSPNAKDTVVILHSEENIRDKGDTDAEGVSKVREENVLRNIGSDFDLRMSQFSSEAETAINRIIAGEMSHSEMLDQMYRLNELYTSTYQKILTEYKSDHPDLSGIDIELAVARHAERSHASQLHLKLSQTIVDAAKQTAPQPE